MVTMVTMIGEASPETLTPPTVARLSVTPVKGLALHHPEGIELTETGAAGDRRFFLIDDRDTLVSITKLGELARFAAEYDPAASLLTLRRNGRAWTAEIRLGGLVHGAFHDREPVAGHVVEGPWSEVLSEAVGQRVRLVRALDGTTAFDVHPATMLGTASVAELGRRSTLGSLDSRRFRMLIELHTQTPHLEDTWTGRRIGVGEAELVVGGPVPRCATVTRNPENGMRDAPIVNAIRAYRGVRETELGPGVNFGVYADVVRAGAVHVGDVVEFLA
jgi:uncharacterized protein YcbX